MTPELKFIGIDELAEPPAPVRIAMDEKALDELTQSIREMGVIQPLVVVPSQVVVAESAPGGEPGDGQPSERRSPRFEIVAGHRRFRAARAANLDAVPCVVYDDEKFAREAAKLHENIYREDITAAEESSFYAELIEKHHCTEAQLCRMVRQKPEYIYARLDLLKGDKAIFDAVAARKINFSVAKELNRISVGNLAQQLQVPVSEIPPALVERVAQRRAMLLGVAIESGASAKTAQGWVHQWRMECVPPPANADQNAGVPVSSEPVEHPIKCALCGGDKDPQNLREIRIHWYELQTFLRLVRQAVEAEAGR